MTARGIPTANVPLCLIAVSAADTLRPGTRRGAGAVAREITEQYAGQIITSDGLLGVARMEVVFGRQHPTQKRNKHFCAFFTHLVKHPVIIGVRYQPADANMEYQLIARLS